MKTHTHTINGIGFIIEEYGPRDEWHWTNEASESKTEFASQADALTDAMAWVREQQAEEQQEPDNYRAETCQSFDLRDYQ